MRKVRELLRLKFEHGLSNRKAAKAIGVGKTAAGEYIAGFNKSGLTLTQAILSLIFICLCIINDFYVSLMFL